MINTYKHQTGTGLIVAVYSIVREENVYMRMKNYLRHGMIKMAPQETSFYFNDKLYGQHIELPYDELSNT